MSSEELKLFEEKKSQYKIKETGEGIGFDRIKKIVSIYQERLKKLSEISELTDFFFKDKLEYDKELLRWPRQDFSGAKMTDKDIKIALDKLEKILSEINNDDWSRENLEKVLIPESEKFSEELNRVGDLTKNSLRPNKNQKIKKDRGYLLWPLRAALTGKEMSAGPFDVADILGKEKTLKRIIKARKILSI